MASETMNRVMQQVAALTSPLSLDEKLTVVKFLIEQAKQDAAAKSNGEEPTDGASQEINDAPKKIRDDVPDRYFRREYEWLRQHRHEYLGQYVVLEGDRLLAHGPDGRKALAEARQAGTKHPVVVRIEAEDELPFGGW
ncbi:MAG: DUF5678 domain-containing protein [Blastocatellia bacterium]